METRKFTFSPRTPLGPALLTHTREVHEALGAVCTVEVTFETRHKFELHTIVCVMPPKLHPVKFTPAKENV